MDPIVFWTAIAVVCGSQTAIFGAIVAFQNKQIRELREENKNCQKEVVQLRENHTDLLLRIVASEDARRKAEHDKHDAEQTVVYLKKLDHLRHQKEIK